jgi:GntR family transcriptional regulator
MTARRRATLCRTSVTILPNEMTMETDRTDSRGADTEGGIPDLDRSPVARYLQLATLFRSRIASGRWPVDERIPNVDTLAQDFGVARETIRQALGLLEREGIVQRFRAKGTFVRRAPDVGAVHTMNIDWATLATAHEGAELEILDDAIADRPSGAVLEGTLAPRYHMMRRRHLREDQPYLVGTLYLDERLYAAIDPERFRHEPTLNILQDVFDDRIARAGQVLTIGAADVEIASLLNIPINAPIAEVRRFALDPDGTLIYVGEGLYRGDAMRLQIDLR